MAYIDLISKIHTRTKRNYLEERVLNCDKAECAVVAKRFDQNYWDGDRKYGYGGYQYDGRWLTLAKDLVEHYQIKPGDRILDIGCGKGYLLYEFTQIVAEVVVAGLDISQYAIDQAKPEVKACLQVGNAIDLPYEDHSFDLVVSINTLHNLYNYDLQLALQEIERVGKDKKYLVVDSYRNDAERINLMYWQLTCECFYTPKEWEWMFAQSGYRGDYGCIYYE